MTNIKEKILRDPYYRSAYKKLHSLEKIYEAGFFDDGVFIGDKKLQSDPRWLSTPVHKIVKRLNTKASKASSFLAVLITTGAFSPIHRGHIEMMELAKQELEGRGALVLGGYLSPSHDQYVFTKYRNTKGALSASHRIQLCEEAVLESDWLMVDRFESCYNDRYINFTDVLVRLKTYLARHAKTSQPIYVVYVFGSDNVGFARAFLGKGYAVCIQRPGYEEKFQKVFEDPLIRQNKRIILSTKSTARPDISSRSMHVIRTSRWLRTPKTYSYFIRDEGDWSVLHWAKYADMYQLRSARKNFLDGLVKIFIHEFRETNIHLKIQILHMEEQCRRIMAKGKKIPILSLDACVKGKSNLEISRLFTVSDGQIRPSALAERPGHDPLKTQIKKIPAGEYMLVEDDIASSATVNAVLRMLPKRILVKGISLLSKYNAVTQRNVLDIVDFRDFLVGSREGGLVVELPNGNFARAPYMLPYVSLVTRAKLPPSREMSFSHQFWKLNAQFFEKIDIPLSATSVAFQTLMKYIGFSHTTSMHTICEWHIDGLKYHDSLSATHPKISQKP